MMNSDSNDWQNVLWREWRHCDDQDYKCELERIVKRQPIGWGNFLLETMVVAVPYAFGVPLIYGVVQNGDNSNELFNPEAVGEIWTGSLAFLYYGIGCAVACFLEGSCC